MKANFTTALAFAWRPENDGQRDHSDKHDPGGETNMGVTHTEWQSGVSRGYVEGELRDASRLALAKLLKLDYWTACKCDALPPGLDLVVFDMAMVSGPGRSIKLLQKALGFEGGDVDGDIGPKTLNAALFVTDTQDLISVLTKKDEAFFASLHTFTYFGRGWDRRAEDAQRAAFALLEAKV